MYSQTNTLKSNSQAAPKIYLRYKDAVEIYSMSKRQLEKIAMEANAIRKVGKMVLLNAEILNEYLETFVI